VKKLMTLLIALALILPIKVNAATVYTISSENYALFPKETVQLNILKYNEPIKAKVKWISSNKKVAAVTVSGKVTAKSKGKATITGIYNKIKYECNIKVTGSTHAILKAGDNSGSKPDDNSGSKPDDNSGSKPGDNSGNSSVTYISLSKYNSLSDGISYADAVKIIGAEGSVLSTVGSGDKTTISYVWYGKDGISKAIVIFTNDKLYSKSQTKLE
jgi:hypothetical protein